MSKMKSTNNAHDAAHQHNQNVHVASTSNSEQKVSDILKKRAWTKPEFNVINIGSEVTAYFYQE